MTWKDGRTLAFEETPVRSDTMDSDGIEWEELEMYPYEEDKALRAAEIASLWAVVALAVMACVFLAVVIGKL